MNTVGRCIFTVGTGQGTATILFRWCPTPCRLTILFIRPLYDNLQVVSFIGFTFYERKLCNSNDESRAQVFVSFMVRGKFLSLRYEMGNFGKFSVEQHPS